ncbi:hypothetical protein GLOIN_2v1762475 [Rhizophagus irregularis DAOM 181602=DAOM 197198]|nr:hypothetical protein GLOIN_2v1762475 [Rhizophagus irregularis DAOM 181602=DAOM 197198]
MDVSNDEYLSRCSSLADSSDVPLFPFRPLLDISTPSQGLLVAFLCNDVPLINDPVAYWHTISDMKAFFELLSFSRFTPLRSSYFVIDWTLTFGLLKDTLYYRIDVSCISASLQFWLQLWFDELPLMFHLRHHYPDLYADDSLCPNCSIFMETFEHFFTCSPDADSSLVGNSSFPIPCQRVLLELMDRFLNCLARKASSSPKAWQDLDSLLYQLKALPSVGFSSLQTYSDSELPRRSACNIILRNFLKLQREIYHQLWRPRCKMKSLKDKALDIMSAILRMTKSSNFTNFHYDTSSVTSFLTNESFSPLQAFKWSSLGLHEEDFNDDEDDPCLILQLISLQVQYNNDLSYYILKKKDIQLTPYERSTSDYPVTPISLSTNLFVDDLFENPVPANLSSHDVDHLDSSLENLGFSDITFDDIISLTINWNNYLDPNADEDDLIEDDLRMDEFMGTMYAAFGLLLVSSATSRSSSPVLVTYDAMSLMFLSDSDDEFSNSDDDFSFLPFDKETFLYYETE